MRHSTKRPRSLVSRCLATLLGGGLAIACGTSGTDEPPTAPRPGELGEGEFLYECVSNDDPMCPSDLIPGEFPERIVTGGEFDVSFEITDPDETQSAVTVRSGSETYIEETSGAFRAVQAGMGVLLARRTVDAATLDFVHLTIVDLESLEITQPGGNPPQVVMQEDETQELRATPSAGSGMVLGGAVPITWSSSDETVIQPIDASPTAFMTVAAGVAGEATITAEAEGQTAELTITVEP